MADMLNQNLNKSTLQNGSNNLRPSKPFGLNVKVPERTIQQISETVKANATSGVSNIFSYLAKNERVFDGFFRLIVALLIKNNHQLFYLMYKVLLLLYQENNQLQHVFSFLIKEG